MGGRENSSGVVELGCGRIASPQALSDTTEPEPDFAIARRSVGPVSDRNTINKVRLTRRFVAIRALCVVGKSDLWPVFLAPLVDPYSGAHSTELRELCDLTSSDS